MRIFFAVIIMKISLTVLAIFFLTSFAIAEEVIYPKGLSKFENFDNRGLEIIQKQFVDEGHQPWRSDPAYYAKFFMNFYYHDLNPNEREALPEELTLEGNEARVRVVYNDKEHTVYLSKVFIDNPESIWVVEKMVVK